MRIISIGEIEAQLVGDQAFLYYKDESNVFNIEGIENAENAKELIEF